MELLVMSQATAEQNYPATVETRERARLFSLRDYSADNDWIAEHRDEYAEQWVALKFGQLISHGKDLKVVCAEADAAGHPDVLLVWVEPSDALPFIF
jgi:hypothetical protein